MYRQFKTRRTCYLEVWTHANWSVQPHGGTVLRSYNRTTNIGRTTNFSAYMMRHLNSEGIALLSMSPTAIVDELLNKRSDINKFYRILVYCLRFLKHSNIVHLARGSISSLKFDVKIVQQYSFPEEHKTLSEGKSVSPTSKIVLLNPYIHGQRRTD